VLGFDNLVGFSGVYERVNSRDSGCNTMGNYTITTDITMYRDVTDTLSVTTKLSELKCGKSYWSFKWQTFCKRYTAVPYCTICNFN